MLNLSLASQLAARGGPPAWLSSPLPDLPSQIPLGEAPAHFSFPSQCRAEATPAWAGPDRSLTGESLEDGAGFPLLSGRRRASRRQEHLPWGTGDTG